MEEKKVVSSIEKLTKTEPIKKASKIDLAHLESLLDSGEKLYAVKNTSQEALILDWNLELLPADLEEEFDKYLEKKYLEYGQEGLIGGPRIVALFQEGRTVNFLNSFLTAKKFPIVLPRAAGKEEEFRSSFVLNADESVILTETQKDSLSRFEKIKRVWEKEGKRKASPWLGFLVFTPIQEGKDLLKYSMSYVTSKDTIESSQEVKVEKVHKVIEEAGIIRAEE